jgi:hypothetical protein
MSIQSAQTKVVATLALLLIGTTFAAVTQRDVIPVTRVQICVKDNGQLRMLIGNNTSCDSSERPMDWMVGGEVTDIQPGPGLVGSREGGTVQLAVDPSIIEGCAGWQVGKVFAGFNDGPGQIPFTLTADLLPIAELNLPAGDYVIFAKLTVEAEPLFDESSFQRSVSCRLTAGTDFDKAGVVLEKIHSESSGEADGSYRMGMTLQVAHSFTAPGRVVLSAGHGGALTIAPQVQFRDLKIIAIEASHISNEFLGANRGVQPR